MIEIAIDRLLWASIGGLLFVVAVLAACRFIPFHPAVKVWACRAAVVKLLVGLVWGIAWQVPAHPTGEVPYLHGYLAAIWSLGFLVVAIGAVAGYRRSCSLHAASRPCDRLHLNRCAVREIDAIEEPFVIGVLRPTLVLPAKREIEPAVLAHELAHIAHRDLAWNLLAWIAYAVFWFVPGIGRLLRELELWQEARADFEARLATSIGAEAQATVLLEALRVRGRESWAVANFTGDAALVARRLSAMFERGYSAPLAVCAALILLPLAVPIRGSVHSASGAREMVSPLASPSVIPLAR